MKRLTAFAVLLLVLPCAMPADAQVVRGRIIDEGAGTAVAGGFVRLVAGDGSIAASTLSTSAGIFQLSAPAGTYFLRVERLGFKTHETEPFQLDTVVVREIRVPQAAIEIPAITGRAERRCDPRGGRAAASAAVWEEVRKVLSVASWTSEHGNVVYQLRSVRQQFDPRTLQLIGEKVEVSMGTMGGSPYAALDSDSLLTHGFVQRSANGTYNYYGPDAELILSEEFQQTHCFQAVTDAKRPGLVGLAFTPNGTIKGPDIEGTLWIDRTSYELRLLEFSYSDLPVNAPRSTAGGDIHFTRLDTGMWILSAWSIRAPIMSTEPRTVVLDCETCAKPDRKSSGTLMGLQKATKSVVTAHVGGMLVYRAAEDGN